MFSFALAVQPLVGYITVIEGITAICKRFAPESADEMIEIGCSEPKTGVCSG